MSTGPATSAAAPDARPRPTVALMYHALSDSAPVPGQDPHYTLSRDTFAQHLAQIAVRGARGTTVREWLSGAAGDGPLLTFDDGHASNHAVALPMLVEAGMTAEFFVNPATVGTPDHCTWEQLRAMSAAGMSIQSHGEDHVYLTHLDAAELRRSLRAARTTIEDRIGSAVTLLAPPGGRMPADLDSVALACGYTHVVASQPGLVRDRAARLVPRMSVTAATDLHTLSAWLAGDRGTLLRERARHEALGTAKRMLGDDRYERVRARALSIIGTRG